MAFSPRSFFLTALGMAIATSCIVTRVCAAPKPISDAAYLDKVTGAWLGKCIGGALGMPIEGWHYSDIDKRYPQITDYVGYFEGQSAGWSGVRCRARIRRDGEWHKIRVDAAVPAFDVANSYVVPTVGMSMECSTEPAVWEIRELKVTRARDRAPLDPALWQPDEYCTFPAPGQARFNFGGQRAWIRYEKSESRKLALRPGDVMRFECEARWVSGDNQVGFAFDYYSRQSTGFGPDDDTSYQIVGLHALEDRGPDISCVDIGREWVEHVPYMPEHLAEGAALKRLKDGVRPPESGEQPMGEAIGGQMKGEIWGLVCPGRPDLASEYGRRDGVIAHCRNGVYGEQFIAAVISAAFYEKDPHKLVETGLRHIPADSKYARVVREVIAWHAKYADWRDTRREVVAKYPEVCDPVYGEAGIVVLALLYGGGDFEKTITIAAACGSDTDCNAATVGAVLGCVHGARAIPAKWKDPINDEFRCFVKGLENWKVSGLAERICAAGRRVLAFHGSGMRFGTPL